jgi:hypothetical protein
MGINFNEHGVWAHWNLPLFELLDTKDKIIDLEIQQQYKYYLYFSL